MTRKAWTVPNVCHLLWTFKVPGSLLGPGSSLLAPQRSVLTALHNWSTVYLKVCCLTNSSAAAFPYPSDVLCMIDLFCLFAPSPRGHIKANFAQSETRTLAEVKRLFVQRRFHLPTSLVIFAIWAEHFGGHVAAQASPSWLANAVPHVLIQNTPPVVVAQPGAAICQHITRMSEGNKKKIWRRRVWRQDCRGGGRGFGGWCLEWTGRGGRGWGRHKW